MIYSDYESYFRDQMVKFQSFEWDLYRKPIEQTIDKIFPGIGYKGNVLDLCCGDGTTTYYLKEKGFKNLQGFDGNPEKIVKALEHVPDVVFFCDDILDMIVYFFANEFDIIYASHCFEHFLDPMKILADCRKLLGPKGSIIMILPYPNEESEGHPGSNLLKLNGTIEEVTLNLKSAGFKVNIEQVNIREPELIIKLTNL